MVHKNIMTPRRRFLTVLDHKIPDRIPIFDFLYSKPLYNEVLEMEIQTYNDMDYYRLAKALGFDATLLTPGLSSDYVQKIITDDIYIDEWGTVFKKNYSSWPIDAPIDYIIKNQDDLKNLKIPNGSDEKRYYGAIEVVEKNNKELAIIATVSSPFTRLMKSLGIERLSEYTYDQPEFLRNFLEIAKNYSLEIISSFKKIGVDVMLIADDLGYSDGTFFNPTWYRENLFPIYNELIKEIKKDNIYVMLHCDGNINNLISDIIEAGFDALNPLERKANMSLKRLREKFGNKLTLSGNVDSSTTLVFGSENDVKEETIKCMLDGGMNGSYILSSDHSFHYDIPNKNIFTMIDTCKKYGKYPLKI